MSPRHNLGIDTLNDLNDPAVIARVQAIASGSDTGDVTGILAGNNIAVDSSLPATPKISMVVGAYGSGVTYAIGNVVTSGGIFYVSKVSPNLAHTPASSPTQWQPIGKVQAVVAGTNVTVDNTDPGNPVVNAAGGVNPLTTAFTSFTRFFTGPRKIDGTVYTNASGRRMIVQAYITLTTPTVGDTAGVIADAITGGVSTGGAYAATLVNQNVASISEIRCVTMNVDPGGMYSITNAGDVGTGVSSLNHWDETVQ